MLSSRFYVSSSLLQSSPLLQFRTHKVIYRRYAGLFFSLCVDITDNELAYLECIHLFVEILDHFFSNVCELDLVFNFHKVCSSFSYSCFHHMVYQCRSCISVLKDWSCNSPFTCMDIMWCLFIYSIYQVISYTGCRQFLNWRTIYLSHYLMHLLHSLFVRLQFKFFVNKCSILLYSVSYFQQWQSNSLHIFSFPLVDDDSCIYICLPSSC